MEARGVHDFTVLHFACYGGNSTIVQYLVETCHVDITIKDVNDEIPLDIAKKEGHTEVVEYLHSKMMT